MNETTEIEGKNLSVHQNNQLDEQGSKNKNQRQEADNLFEECTKLFQINDKWKGSVNESLIETIAKIQVQEDVIKHKFEKLTQWLRRETN